MKNLLLFCFLLANINCIAKNCPIEPQGVPSNTKTVSMLSIIVTANIYNNQPISLTGVLYINKDNQILLFNSKESVEYFILRESIILDFKPDDYKIWLQNLKHLNGEYVNITGTFHASSVHRAGYLSNILVLCRSGTRKQLITVRKGK